MKKLVHASGPRDSSLMEVTLHIANLGYQIKCDREIFEDKKQTNQARLDALERMHKGIELLSRWKEVRQDIIKKRIGSQLRFGFY